MLDRISSKILIELCSNGYSSNASIAQTLGFSAITVAKKINALINDGVIAIKAIPNPVKMGYNAAAFIGLKIDLKELDNICALLMDNIHVNWAITCFGRFDILLIVYFREWKMLHNFIEEGLPGIKGVKHIETYLISGAKKRYQDIYPSCQIESKLPELDEIDKLLIKELIRDGRPNYSELAHKLGVSVSTISRRISSLLREEIIEIRAIPNPSKLGYSTNANVLLHIELSKANEICDRLSRYPEVNLVMRIMNDFDVLFAINATEPEALYSFLKNKIANIDGILSMETFIRASFQYFSADALFTPYIE